MSNDDEVRFKRVAVGIYEEQGVKDNLSKPELTPEQRENFTKIATAAYQSVTSGASILERFGVPGPIVVAMVTAQVKNLGLLYRCLGLDCVEIDARAKSVTDAFRAKAAAERETPQPAAAVEGQTIPIESLPPVTLTDEQKKWLIEWLINSCDDEKVSG
jgi:hypothetical protein